MQLFPEAAATKVRCPPTKYIYSRHLYVYLFVFHLPMLSVTPMIRGSAVGTVTRLGAEFRERVVRTPAGVRDLGSKGFRPMLVSTKSLLCSGYRELFPQGKATGA